MHGDLSNNVLFAPGLAPAIIDFSPYWRPVPYADAIALVDGLLGRGAPAALLDGHLGGAEDRQYAARAWLFRAAALSQFIDLEPESPAGLAHIPVALTVAQEILARL